LERYLEEVRKERKRDTLFEWFQWLAERMMDLESKTPHAPAHVAHRTWIQEPSQDLTNR
jgi:hypothetical protein